MSGRQFDPSTCAGAFVGLVFISSARSMASLPGRVMPQVSAGATWMRASGRAYNGHTALIAGHDGQITTTVGWDPESPLSAFIKSTLWGYGGMNPVPGGWGDDIGMDADSSARYFGVPVSSAQHYQFRHFIESLIGRNDFGEHLAESNVGFSYSFKPNQHMQRLEASNLTDRARIVANCGDAAFHVLATFLYEWSMKPVVDELRSYIMQDDRTMNFSQGLLMRWAQEAPT
ncbi:MAG: hypothetical protein AB1Z98_39795 [Nannocystaceae bacterium]